MKYLLTFLLTLNCFAVVPIKTGQISPIDGYVFSVKEEKKLREINMKKIALEDLSIKQDTLINVQSERIKLLQTEVDNSKLTTLEKCMYVGLGILVTGTSVYLAGKLK